MDRTALRELVASLKHDLGKSVAWRSANLDEAAWKGPITPLLVDCLRADVLETRTGPQGHRPAWQVFAELVAPLPRPLSEPELRDVEAAVERLRRLGPVLLIGNDVAIASVRGQVREAQAVIRRRLADLHRRLMAED